MHVCIIQKLQICYLQFHAMNDSAELSKHFWEMKRKVIKKPLKNWSVIDHAKPY